MKSSAYLINSGARAGCGRSVRPRYGSSSPIGLRGRVLTSMKMSQEWPRAGRLPHALAAPHLGSATHATRAAMSRIAGENLVAALEGRTPSQPR